MRITDKTSFDIANESYKNMILGMKLLYQGMISKSLKNETIPKMV